ncbi:hypothetical protein [Spirillospora sp. NPDC047279]|uniref:hypothetical protein n=1 Tax=Spirillospora sp. NPDC047279 TaxID=3155478 RepID=UPI0033DB8BC0
MIYLANHVDGLFARFPVAGHSPDLRPREEPIVTKMSLAWSLLPGGAQWTAADDQTTVQATASYLRAGPEDLLTAVARLVLGESETRADFEDEPITYRWIFRRTGDDVHIRVLELADYKEPDLTGTELWSSRQTVDSLARGVIRGFDEVVWKHEKPDSTRRGVDRSRVSNSKP